MEVGWRRAYLLERLRTFSWVLAPLKGKKEKRTCIVEPKLASHEHVAHAEAPFVTGAHFSLSLPPFLLLLLSFLLSCLFVCCLHFSAVQDAFAAAKIRTRLLLAHVVCFLLR